MSISPTARMNFLEERAVALEIAAERLGLDRLDRAGCVVENRDGGWRIGVIGDGKAPTFNYGISPEGSVEVRVVHVSEEDVYAERPA